MKGKCDLYRDDNCIFGDTRYMDVFLPSKLNVKKSVSYFSDFSIDDIATSSGGQMALFVALFFVIFCCCSCAGACFWKKKKTKKTAAIAEISSESKNLASASVENQMVH